MDTAHILIVNIHTGVAEQQACNFVAPPFGVQVGAAPEGSSREGDRTLVVGGMNTGRQAGAAQIRAVIAGISRPHRPAVGCLLHAHQRPALLSAKTPFCQVQQVTWRAEKGSAAAV